MKLDKDNKVVNGLWIGDSLSPLEMLTLRSFVHYGHEFHLWVYHPLDNDIPDGVILKDANEIIPEKKIFVRKYDDPDLGIGKGSVGAPFSDIFRYKLLYEKGGWWVDMDVTCLKPLNFKEDFVFRTHSALPMIGNLMKIPKGSPFIKKAYDIALATCDENTLDWLLPNKILNDQVKKSDLEHFIKDNISNNDHWEEAKSFSYNGGEIPKDWFAIHWMNEEWRKQELPKDLCREQSALGKLYQKYDIKVKWGSPYKPPHTDWQKEFKRWRDKWSLKGKNWLKNPGVPVFIKKLF